MPKKKAAKKEEPQFDEYDFAEPTVEYIDPPEEAGGPVLELSDAQLAEEVTCVLTADDPNQPKNIASYSFKDKSFRPQPPLAHGSALQGSARRRWRLACRAATP